jgi:hypothetical protein
VVPDMRPGHLIFNVLKRRPSSTRACFPQLKEPVDSLRDRRLGPAGEDLT